MYFDMIDTVNNDEFLPYVDDLDAHGAWEILAPHVCPARNLNFYLHALIDVYVVNRALN